MDRDSTGMLGDLGLEVMSGEEDLINTPLTEEEKRIFLEINIMENAIGAYSKGLKRYCRNRPLLERLPEDEGKRDATIIRERASKLLSESVSYLSNLASQYSPVRKALEAYQVVKAIIANQIFLGCSCSGRR